MAGKERLAASAQCRGGKYDPTPSPRRSELPPRYYATESQRYARHDGPEDGSLSNRCLARGLPEFSTALGGSLRRIVQTPGGISMLYEIPFGQGFQRNIVMDGRRSLPGIRWIKPLRLNAYRRHVFPKLEE